MSTLPVESQESGGDEEVLSPEDLQVAPLVAKLREWNLAYEVDREFPIANVQRPDTVQVRQLVHIAPEQRVAEYAQQMRNGALFPPILLRTPNLLIDGNTRIAAAKRVGRKTLPAIIVDTKTPEMAKILAGAINQMGGERLTPNEAHEVAEMMMRQSYPDAAIARELGRDVSQVRRWRNQRNVEERAQRLGLKEKAELISPSTLPTLAGIAHDEPFAELTKLFADVRPKQADAKELAQQVVQATSDQAALQKIAELREELAPAGPPPHAATRSEIPLVHAAIANLLKLEGRVTAGIDPAKREKELELWERVRRLADEILQALRS